MMGGTIEPAHLKPWLAEEAALSDVSAWLLRRPGVFGPRSTATECYQDALAAFKATGTRCALSLFKFQLRRIGYSVEQGSGGYRLDLSDRTLAEDA